MRRRTFLASATAALPIAGAGCTTILDKRGQDSNPERSPEAHGARIPAARLQMMAVDNTDIGQRHAHFVEQFNTKRRLVIERTVENGSTRVDGEGPPARGDKPVVYDRSVYRISYRVVNERPATRYFWNLEPTDGGSDEETVQFEDLPRLDREKFRLVGLADGAYGERNSLDVGMTFKYANEDRDESALVPTPERPIIVWGPDRRARFSVTNSNSKNATLKTYEYTVKRLAPTVEAYGQQLRERYTFELSGLSDAERNIVDQAIGEHGYTVERGESPPDAFWSLADRFRQQEAVEDRRDGVTGEYLATYEGQIYGTELINGDDYNTGKTATTSA